MTYINSFSTNRSFRQVDERFGFKLGDEIQKRIRVKPDLTVCDIACGLEGIAISELARDYPYLKGIGLDYQAEAYESERLELINGDLFEIPFENISDVTYCAFVLADVTSDDYEEHTNKIARATFQIAKTLVQGGVAFIDERSFSGAPYSLYWLVEELEKQNPGYSERFATARDPDIGLIGNYMTIHRLEDN
jgi:hypothetical protein